MEAKRFDNKIFILILLLFVFSGCEEYLTEENPSEVTTDFLYTTADGLQAAVNGLYTIERAQVSESEANNVTFILGDGGTDIEFNRAAAQDLARFRPEVDLTTNGTVRSWWQKWYRIIERSNSIITFGEEAEIEAEQKMKILREAYVYRAYAYFWLVRKFDNIWLNTEPTTYMNADGRSFPVATQAEVYTQIISDLDKAIQYYGNDWSVVPGKFNQGVARLLRADVALWQKDWATAATHSTKIITDGPFALEQPENVWAKDRRRNSKESMYVWQFDEFVPGGGPYHRFSLAFTAQYRLVPGTIVASEFGGYGWARVHPNPYLLSLYDSKYDKRWNAWWQHYYTYNNPEFDFSKLKYGFGDTLKVGQNSQMNGDNYYRNAMVSCKKYWDWEKEPITTRAYNNVYIYRYPHVLLIAAEAYMRQGDNTNALTYINQIRQNRIMGTAPNQLLTTINEDILLEEYARELAFEGHRWFLLKRVEKLIERVQLYSGVTTYNGVKAPNALYYASRTNIKPFHVRWPIPQAERDAMGGFPQNEGYNQ